MAPRMVRNLETHLVELCNLLPGHVVLLVLKKAQAFGHKKGSSKSIFLQLRCHE